MSVLDQIAFFQNRRDEVPNQELARALAEAADIQGIQEIAENLWNKNDNIRSDCLKVLYEIGYLRPDLIAGHSASFLKLLRDRNNRMVWGAMIGLGTIAGRCPAEIWAQIDEVIAVIDRGSLITVVWGVKVLAQVAAASPEYQEKLLPVLLGHLQKCLARDVPTHGESMLCAVDADHRAQFRAALEARQAEMTPAQQARLKKVLKAAA
jgi:hypothetical protein